MADTTVDVLDNSLAGAAKAIEGLLDLGDSPPKEAPKRAPRQAAPAPEPVEAEEEFVDPDEGSADQVAEQPDLEDADYEGDELDEGSAIQPPSFWTSEDKDLFRDAPPEAQEWAIKLQEAVARTEAQRNKAVDQKMKGLAGERKSTEARATEIATQQLRQVEQHYANQLTQLYALSIPDLKKFEGVDFVKLAYEDPTKAYQLETEYRAVQGRIGQVQNLLAQVQQNQQQQNLTKLQTFAAEQMEKALQAMPELADPGKRESKINRMKQAARQFEFTDDELNSVHDHRVLKILDWVADRMSRDKVVAKAQEKRTPSPAPKLIQPNAAPTRDASSANKLDRQMAKLKKSNSMKDAVRIFEQHL